MFFSFRTRSNGKDCSRNVDCYDFAIRRFAVHLLLGLGDKFMLLASRQGRMSHPARHVHDYLFDVIVKSVMDVLGRLVRVLLCNETAAV